MKRPRDDDGSVLLLILGLVALLVVLVTVVTDVTVLFLARKDLLAAADGSALAGAQQVDAERLYTRGIDIGPLPLDPAAAEAAVHDHLADAGLGDRWPGMSVEVVTTATTVTVRLGGRAQLPFVSHLVPSAADGVEVAAGASATTLVVG